MAKSDIYEYHKKESYPSTTKPVIGLLFVFGSFIAFGVYSLWQLWNQYGAQILQALDDIGLPNILTDNALTIVGLLGSLVILSLLLSFGASSLAKKLGGTLIYIGAFFMNVMAWLAPVLLIVASGFNFAIIASSWPIMIPGFFTLFITLLLFTVWKDKVKRAGELIKLTGQVCLDEKGVFIPPLLTMIFTLVAAALWAGIIFYFVPFDVLIGTIEPTLEQNVTMGLGVVIYLFVTIFFYYFAYGVSSAMVYLYMRGQDPDIGDGFKATLSVVGGIIVLSIASVIVKLVILAIQAISRKSGPGGRALGRLVSGIINWVWALVNYFTIPVMVAERKGAKDGIKRSASLVKNNFVDVIIKETAVRWGFGVLAAMFFIAFAVGGAVIGWFIFAGDILMTIVIAIIFTVFAGIPSTLTLRTFDIVYVTLLYVFIRRKEGDISGKTAIPSAMSKELDSAYSRAQRSY